MKLFSFKKITATSVLTILLLSHCAFAQTISTATQTSTTTPQVSAGTTQCNDGIDNDGDGKADEYGVTNKDGTMKYEPDPSCFSPSATSEQKDDVAKGSIVPCTDKCTFSDVFKLLNNFLTFFITTLLIPIFIIIVMYAGVKYLQAGANGGAKANVKSMLWHIIGGIILILCAWLIVHTIMTTLLNDDFQSSGVEFLGK